MMLENERLNKNFLQEVLFHAIAMKNDTASPVYKV